MPGDRANSLQDRSIVKYKLYNCRPVCSGSFFCRSTRMRRSQIRAAVDTAIAEATAPSSLAWNVRFIGSRGVVLTRQKEQTWLPFIPLNPVEGG